MFEGIVGQLLLLSSRILSSLQFMFQLLVTVFLLGPSHFFTVVTDCQSHRVHWWIAPDSDYDVFGPNPQPGECLTILLMSKFSTDYHEIQKAVDAQ